MFKGIKMEPNEEPEIKEKEPLKPTGIVDIAGGDLPEVKENAIAAVQEQKQAAISKAVNEEGFDPQIHVTDAEGNPVRNKSGTLKKKRGRKKGSKVGSKSQLNLDPPKEDENVTLGSHEAAQVISGLLEQAQVKLVSDEFIYTEIERTGNIEAWRQTLDHYGGLTLTPPQALVLSHLQIIISRAASPENKKTQEKFKLAGEWVKLKLKKITFKRAKKDGAHADNRKDAKRKDNTSDENGGGKKKAGD